MKPHMMIALLAATRTPGGFVNERLVIPVLEIIGGFGPAARPVAATLEPLAVGTGPIAEAANAALTKITAGPATKEKP